jgi:hypothetical protein
MSATVDACRWGDAMAEKSSHRLVDSRGFKCLTAFGRVPHRADRHDADALAGASR